MNFHKYKDKLFPLLDKKNVRHYYLLTILNASGWFIVGNWIFFWLRYMNYSQLGIVDGVAFAFGLLLDVPTGAIADLIGRKRTIIASQFFSFLGVILIATARSITPIFIGWMIAQFGWSLYSGAMEALTYDSLKKDGAEEDYQKVASASGTLGLIFGVIFTLTGGLLYVVNFRLPHLAWAFSYFFGLIVALYLVEIHFDKQQFSIKVYFNQLSLGAKELLIPSLVKFVPLIFVVLGIYYLFIYGFIQPATSVHFGFFATGQSIIQGIIGVIVAVLVGLIPQMRKKLTDFMGLAILALTLGLGFLFAALPIGYWGFFVILLIRSAGALASPWVSVIVNREILSKYRATALSTISLMSKVPYVLVSILAGGLVQNGKLGLFNISVGLVVLVVLVISVFIVDKRILTKDEIAKEYSSGQ